MLPRTLRYLGLATAIALLAACGGSPPPQSGTGQIAVGLSQGNGIGNGTSKATVRGPSAPILPPEITRVTVAVTCAEGYMQPVKGDLSLDGTPLVLEVPCGPKRIVTVEAFAGGLLKLRGSATVAYVYPASRTTAYITLKEVGSMTLLPETVTVQVGQNQQFTATVFGYADGSVSWSAGGVAGGNATVGTITVDGLYTAPAAVPSPPTVMVRATSNADYALFRDATVTVTPVPQPVTVTVDPPSATVGPLQQQQFTAIVTGTSDTRVTWAVNGVPGGDPTVGTIDGNGLYIAPATVPGAGTVTVRATSVADPTRSGSATVTIRTMGGIGLLADADTVALYKFEETAIGAAVDSSVYGNDGVDHGSTTVQGPFGNARQFNGSSDYVDIELSRQALQGRTQLTVEFLAASPSLDQDVILYNSHCGNGWTVRQMTAGIQYGIKTNSAPYCGWTALSGLDGVAHGVSPPIDAEWHYYALTWDGVNLSIYLDGAMAGSTPAGGTFAQTAVYPGEVTTIAWDQYGNNFFNGMVDEVRISRVARPAAEIRETWRTLAMALPVRVTVTPAADNVSTGRSRRFSSEVTGTADTRVTWSVGGIPGGNVTIGTIDAAGLYTAPSTVPSPATVTVAATSVADPAKSGTSTVTILAAASVVDLPETGQTLSYAAGDDGALQAGVPFPRPRFTTGTGAEDACVTDNLTGLMWVKSPDSTLRTWQEGLDYANGLSLCGYDDWRLPNRKELWSLVDYSRTNPAIPEGSPFTNVQSDYYWSSTTFMFNYDPNEAWHFSMAVGASGGGSAKSTPRYVWPVRSRQSGAVALPESGQTASYATGDDGDLKKGIAWPSPRFTAGSGAEADCVKDNLTGLMWVKSPDRTPRTWQDALVHANNLSLCGYDDWRMPNVNELESVTNPGEPNAAAWLNSQGFSNLVYDTMCVYWSSTTYAGDPGLAWRTGLCSSNFAGMDKTQSWYVWPVRSGQSSVQIPRTDRVSVDISGGQGNGYSGGAYSISADGRFVAFMSDATNLVAGDTNGTSDVFVHDRQTRQTARVSVDSAGNQGNGASYISSISADGRFVAFDSRASNLVAGDTNGTSDVFFHDRQTGGTTRVSVDGAGNQGNNSSTYPSITPDGRYVAFVSSATNLVVGGTPPGRANVFVHDRQAGETTVASVDGSGVPRGGGGAPPSISADGRYVAFYSYFSDLVAGDTNGVGDIFVHDRQTGETTRVSVDSAGNQGNGDCDWPSISADGRYVAFSSSATNLVPGDTNGLQDTFVHDRQTGQTVRVSVDSAGNQGNSQNYWPVAISADGRYVVFGNDSDNLVPGDTNTVWDIFRHDLQTRQTVLVSTSSSGIQADGNSYGPAISADGRYVAFESQATNLVPGDTNGAWDVFVVDMQ